MNNFARRTGCLLWALLTVAVSATARPIGEYSLAYLDMSTGLPANFVDDIYEDSQGFVWICTQGGGLARYDGYGYRYMYAGGQGLSMRSNSCRNVVEDPYKRLWVSFDECTQVIDLRTMTIIVPPTKTPQLGQRLERALNEPGMRNYLDSKGVLWIATKRYIRRLLMDEQGVITGIEECPVTSNTPDIALCDVNGDGSVWTHYDAKLWQITRAAESCWPGISLLFTRRLRAGFSLAYCALADRRGLPATRGFSAATAAGGMLRRGCCTALSAPWPSRLTAG